MAKKKEPQPDAFSQLEYQRKKRSSLDGLAQLAKAGDIEALKAIAGTAAHHIESGTEMPEPVKRFLALALEEIDNGKDPNHAFGYTRTARGAKQDYRKDVRDADMARGVQYYRDQGMTRNDAIEEVAKTYKAFSDRAGKVSRDSVVKAYALFFSSSKGKK